MWRLIPIACVLFAALGCGASDRREAVSGSVTLDGQPLARGSIRFEPLDAESGQAAGAVIAQGKFHVERSQGLMPGTYRAAISSPRTDPAAAPSMDDAGPAEEQIPQRYNVDTELQIVVEPGGANHFTFDLDANHVQ